MSKRLSIILAGALFTVCAASVAHGPIQALCTMVSNAIEYITPTHSVLLDGVDEDINFGTGVADIEYNTAFSVYLWTKWDSSDTDWSGIVANYNQSTGKGWFFQKELSVATARVCFASNFGGGENACASSNSAMLVNGTWGLVGFSYDGSDDVSGITLYVNDSAVADTDDSNGLAGNTIIDAGADLTVGRIDNTAHPYKGNVMFLTIVQKEMSGAEFSEAYNSGTPVDPRSLSFSGNVIHFAPLGSGGDAITDFAEYIGSNNGVGTNLESGDIETDVP